VLRREAQSPPGGGAYFHSAFTGMAVRIGSAGLLPRWNAAMAKPATRDVQIIDAQRVPEARAKLFELRTLRAVGFS